MLQCFDPTGREIVARLGQWVAHIEDRHPELDEHFGSVELTLTDPYRITEDTKHPDRLNYDRAAALPPPFRRLYLKVCVGFRSSGRTSHFGEVITAYPTGRIGRGEVQRWP